MFLLHQRTRKSICRLGFVALCVLPTCAVALWAANRNSQAYRDSCAAECGRLLKLSVSLGGVEHLEPGVVRYGEIALADPQTARPLATAPTLDVHTGQTAISLSAAKLTIEAEAAHAITVLLHDRLRDRTGGARSLRMACGELIVASPSGDISLTDVLLRIEPNSEGRGAEVTFRTADLTADSRPVTLTIVRDRNGRIGFNLQTHGAFANPARDYSAVVQLLRKLLSDQQVVAPASPEAEQLLRLPAL